MSSSTFVVSLVHVSCYKCGVVFGIEASHNARLVSHPGTDFYCPNVQNCKRCQRGRSPYPMKPDLPDERGAA